MDPVPRATLVTDRGIRGNANQGGRRQVTLLQEEAWDEVMAELGASISPASRRANFLVRGVDLADSEGRVVIIGSCRIRVMGETVPCSRMDDALPGLQEAMVPRWRGGAYGVVVTGGTIQVGDQVQLEEPAPTPAGPGDEPRLEPNTPDDVPEHP